MISQRNLLPATAAASLLLLSSLAQSQPFGGPPAPGPAALDPDARPARSCESLAGVALPDTTIELAAVDGNLCRIAAVSTHPPGGDRVTIWVFMPTRRPAMSTSAPPELPGLIGASVCTK